MVDFVTHVLWNTYFNICGHKSETMWYMELKNGKSDKHLRHFKHTKFVKIWGGPYNSLVIGYGMTL